MSEELKCTSQANLAFLDAGTLEELADKIKEYEASGWCVKRMWAFMVEKSRHTEDVG